MGGLYYVTVYLHGPSVDMRNLISRDGDMLGGHCTRNHRDVVMYRFSRFDVAKDFSQLSMNNGGVRRVCFDRKVVSK